MANIFKTLYMRDEPDGPTFYVHTKDNACRWCEARFMDGQHVIHYFGGQEEIYCPPCMMAHRADIFGIAKVRELKSASWADKIPAGATRCLSPVELTTTNKSLMMMADAPSTSTTNRAVRSGRPAYTLEGARVGWSPEQQALADAELLEATSDVDQFLEDQRTAGEQAQLEHQHAQQKQIGGDTNERGATPDKNP